MPQSTYKLEYGRHIARRRHPVVGRNRQRYMPLALLTMKKRDA